MRLMDVCETLETVEDRLGRVLAVHFDPRGGTPFWLDRAARLGVDPLRDVRRIEDLSLLGNMTAGDLLDRPLRDYVPQRLHSRLDRFVVTRASEDCGGGAWAAYRQDAAVPERRST